MSAAYFLCERWRLARLCARAILCCTFPAWGLVAQQPSPTEPVDSLDAHIPRNAERYTVLDGGQRSGELAVWWESKRVAHSRFADQYLTSKIRRVTDVTFTSAGLPRFEHIVATESSKAPVDEQFQLRNGFAVWTSAAEVDSVSSADDAFYLPPVVDQLQLAWLARVRRRHGGSVRLLPHGSAHVSIVDHLSVTVDSRSKVVTLFSITGVDYLPRYVWLDAHGELFESRQYQTVIRSGWESSMPQLLAAQNLAITRHARNVTTRLTHRPLGLLVVQNVSVFDALGDSVVHNQDVVVRDSIIQSVAPTSPRSWPNGSTLVDGRNRMVFPGLWDMHTHVFPSTGMLDLAAGVTSARDLGNEIDPLLERRARIARGTELGPRIVLAGLIDSPDPAQHSGILVTNETEARAAVDRYADLGYVQSKLYNSLPPSLVPVIIEEAHRRGMRVSGHVPQTMTATECVQLGYDELQHFSFVLLNFQPDAHARRTLNSAFADYANTANLDVQSEQVRAFIALLVAHHVAIDPTLNLMEGILLADSASLSPTLAAVEARLPEVVRRTLPHGVAVPAEERQQMRRAFPVMLALVKAMYDAGVPIEVGTDNLAGFALERELELDVQAGIPAPAALHMATLGAARIMRKDSTLGSVTPGKLADLVLIDGDATRSISDIRRVVLTVKDGAVYYPAELYSELGITP